MQINAPSALIKGVLGTLIQELRTPRAGSLLGNVSMLVPSTSDSETYAWLGEAPRLRELDDDAEVIYDGMSDASYALTNAIWKAGLAVKRKDWDDQKFPAITRRVRQLAGVARNHINRLTIDALINGDTTTCYTGENFFNNTHAARGQQTATQDNIMAGTGTTVAQMQTDIMDAIEVLASFLSENNEPFNEAITRVGVVHPVALMGTAREAVFGQIVSNTSNARFGDLEISLFPNARLDADDANDFYVCDISDPSDLPIVIQQRDPVEVASKMDGDDAFDRELYKFTARWRGVSGYGHWQRAVKVTNT